MKLRKLPIITLFIGAVLGMGPHDRAHAEGADAPQAEVTEPKPGTPERKAIMDAMRVPVSKHVGKSVTFTGEVRVKGDWACFRGNVAPTDGKVPEDEDIAADLELDFFALLEKDGDGKWQVKHWGFSGDISVSEEAREKFPEAPEELFE
ncbi:MAG: hypothetical protein MUF13_07045 [Akkermansiaceae bacterium]|jgi:hypothetical protein|nr:hypothetical protein [Akkermansiaceae bacterium]